MKTLLRPNLGRGGRIARALLGVAMVGAGLALRGSASWACLGLVMLGAFALVEAARGWCVLRACGIKTRI